MGGCEAVRNVIVYQRTGGNVAFDGAGATCGARARREAGRYVRARVGRRRASAVHPLHVGLDRQAEGRAAQLGRLPAVGDADDEVDVRHQAVGRLLVHRRHRLGHRPHLHRVRAAGRAARPRSCSKACRPIPDAGPLLEDDPGPQGHDLLHGADRDPLADQGVRRRRRRPRRRTTTCRACACSAPSASRSIPKPGCGTTRTSAAAAARSSIPGGRPKPAAT